MLGLIYAYTEEYKHNGCFLKYLQNVQFVQNKTSQNFKMSVTCIYRYDCCEMNVFFFQHFCK